MRSFDDVLTAIESVAAADVQAAARLPAAGHHLRLKGSLEE